MAKEDVARIYKINKPGFLSCGCLYVTNTDNRIILTDPLYNGKLAFTTKASWPYTLARFPVPKQHHPGRLLSVGMVVYPRSDCDTPSMEAEAETAFHPRILRVSTMPLADLEGFVKIHNYQVKEHNKSIKAKLAMVLRGYKPMLRQMKARQQKIKESKRPELADILRGWS